MKNIYTLLLLVFCSFSAFAQPGPAGKAYYMDYDQFQMDNIRRYLNCGNDASLNPGTQLTMECWVRIHDSNWNQKIVGKLNPSFNSGYLLGVDQGKCYPEVWTPSNSNDLQGFIPPLGYWYHFATTVIPGDSMRIYVNGEFVGGVPVPGTSITSNTDDLIIGIAPWDLSNFQYFGHIDEVRLWSTARSGAEIFSSLHKPLSGSEIGLIGYWDFNAATIAGGASDMSNNSNDCSFIQCDASNITDSRAVIGDGDIVNSSDVHGLWNGNGFTNPRLSLTDNGLSLVDTITDWDYAVFGHDNGTGVSTSDLPTGASATAERTERIWYYNEVGDLSPIFSFDLDNAAGGGTVLNNTLNVGDYYLCYRAGTTGNFTAIRSADTKNGNTILFNEINMGTGYYTLVASTDNLTGIGSSFASSRSLLIYPNPGAGLYHFQLSQPMQEAAQLRVYNVNGAVVFENDFPLGVQVDAEILDLSGTAKGQYFVELRSASQRLVGRVIVE